MSKITKRKPEHNDFSVNKKTKNSNKDELVNSNFDEHQYTSLYNLFFGPPRSIKQIKNGIEKFNQDINYNHKYSNGETLLMIAFKQRNIIKAEYLIENGAKVTEEDNGGNSPLHYLMTYYNIKADPNNNFYKFLKLGQNNLFIINKQNQMPIDLAKKNNNFKPLQIETIQEHMQEVDHSSAGTQDLTITKQKDDSFYQKMMMDYINYDRMAIKRLEKFYDEHQAQIDINHKYTDGKTLLICSSINYSLNKCRFLISKGANIKQTDDEGSTALMHLLKNNDVSNSNTNFDYNLSNLIDLLISTLSITNNKGETAVDIAKKNPHISIPILNILEIKSGHELSIKDTIEISAEEAYNNALETLINVNETKDFIKKCQIVKDLNYKFANGQTLLMAAFISHSLKKAEYLIDMGADLGQTDSEGNTAMHLFFEYYNKLRNINNTLIKFANLGKSLISVQNNEGLTPLNIAEKNSYINFAKLTKIYEKLSPFREEKFKKFETDELDGLFEDFFNDELVNTYDLLPDVPLIDNTYNDFEIS